MLNITDMYSFRSPKNKFSAEVTFEPASKELGSVISAGSMTLEGAVALVRKMYNDLTGKHTGHLCVRENKAEWPSFDWHIVREENWQ